MPFVIILLFVSNVMLTYPYLSHLKSLMEKFDSNLSRQCDIRLRIFESKQHKIKNMIFWLWGTGQRLYVYIYIYIKLI